MVFGHPTMSEAVHEVKASRGWQRSHAKLRDDSKLQMLFENRGRGSLEACKLIKGNLDGTNIRAALFVEHGLPVSVGQAVNIVDVS